MRKIVVESYGGKTECWISVGKYYNGNMAIELECDEGPFICMTLNTKKKLTEGLAAVKDWSENDFVPAMLRKYKLALPTVISADGYTVWRFDMDRVQQYTYHEPKKTIYEKLASAVSEAAYQADWQIVNANDEGTCNLDHVLVKLPRYQTKKVEEIADRYGMSVYKSKAPFWSFNKVVGQANRQTAWCNKFAEIMHDEGYEAFVESVMD